MNQFNWAQPKKKKEFEYVHAHHTYIDNLGVAAAVLVSGIEPICFKKQMTKVVTYFDRSPELDALTNKYFTNELKVNAREMFKKISELRAMNYNLQDGQIHYN